jgi:hypothetical protein
MYESGRGPLEISCCEAVNAQTAVADEPVDRPIEIYTWTQRFLNAW